MCDEARNSKQSSGSKMYRVWKEWVCGAREVEGAGKYHYIKTIG